MNLPPSSPRKPPPRREGFLAGVWEVFYGAVVVGSVTAMPSLLIVDAGALAEAFGWSTPLFWGLSLLSFPWLPLGVYLIKLLTHLEDRNVRGWRCLLVALAALGVSLAVLGVVFFGQPWPREEP